MGAEKHKPDSFVISSADVHNCFVFSTKSNIHIISIFCSWVIKLKCFASARTLVNYAHHNKNLALINFVNICCNVVLS